MGTFAPAKSVHLLLVHPGYPGCKGHFRRIRRISYRRNRPKDVTAAETPKVLYFYTSPKERGDDGQANH